MSKPDPTPDDIAEAREFAWRTIDRAIARYHETRDIAERGRALEKIDESLARWVELETDLATASETHLIRCILATMPEWHTPGSIEKYLWPTRGVRSYDVTYLVTPDSQYDLTPGRSDGPDRMRLVVFRADAVLNITNADVVIISLPPRRLVTPDPKPLVDPVLLGMVHEMVQLLGEDAVIRRLCNAPVKPKGGAGGTDSTAP